MQLHTLSLLLAALISLNKHSRIGRKMTTNRENGPALNLDDILAADDIKIESVDVPQWGGTVYLRTITGDQRDAFDEKFTAGKSLIGMRRCFVGVCLCDSAGVFCAPSESEVCALGRKSSAARDRLFGVAQRINGMRPEQMDDIAKNLPTEAESDSGS